MTTLAPDKAITLGHPSYVWRTGQERRLDLVRRYVPLEGKRVLDIGCGIGTYVRRMQELSPETYGVDIDPQRVTLGAESVPNLAVAVGEYLPFADESFDVVLLNEVIEHVTSDRDTMREAYRILKPGGAAVIYAPNRLYFFETHGVYLGKRYVFGNVPGVNWLPNPLRNRLVPHARAYTAGGINRVLRGLPFTTTVRSYVYPGFDNIVARRRRLGRLMKRVFYFCETTPLRVFGLSHFVVLQKPGQGSRS